MGGCIILWFARMNPKDAPIGEIDVRDPVVVGVGFCRLERGRFFESASWLASSIDRFRLSRSGLNLRLLWLPLFAIFDDF